jgi:glycosyltransferase involved in cell wall biosynthesis
MTKQLNIGIVANTAFNIYNFRLGLIKALEAKGHKVFAIAPSDNYVDLLKEEQINFIALKQLSRKGTNPINDLKLINEFRKLYKENKLDVVLQYTIKPNIYGTFAAKLIGIKSVCTVTGLGYTFLNNSIASKVAHRLYRLAFSFTDKVLFQNNDDVQTFLEHQLVDKDKTQVVPGSGIDTDRFSPDFCEVKNDDGITRFLMIGRLLKDKGVNEYIIAAKNILQKNKHIEFHLLGEIDNQNPSAIKTEELQLWINTGIIHYHKHTKDTRPYICHADCVVLPSYREGMPRVILEGMAMGKPCITTDAPGCKDSIIDNESGFICKTADVDALQQTMEHFILLDKNDKIRLGNNARYRAKNIFSTENINNSYLELLSKLF